MRLKGFLVAGAVAALPAVAAAQPVTGLYVGAGAGANFRSASDVTVAGIPVDRNSMRTGYATVVSLGWGFGNGIRAEIEGSYRYNHAHSTVTSVVPRTTNVRQYGVMGNALYDFDLGGFGISPRLFMPYVGAGAGYIWTEYHGIGRGGRFGYQGIVGGAVGLNDFVPGLALTVEYRYLGTLEPRLSPTLLRTTSGNHSAMLGLRYAFYAPRPAVAPAPAAPAQQVARTYLVFFDWDRADLTDRARQIIAEAAAARTTVRSTRIEVAGHADRSGSPQYNQGLSMRRAQAVAAELERRGVPRAEMVIQAFGESRPLVPTADGVREPQNRRVEIVLR